MQEKQHVFKVYRGLQRPLTFKGFKGKYIYWGLGAILIGLISSIVIVNIGNYFLAVCSFLIIGGGGSFLCAVKQRKGLYHKKSHRGIFIVPCNYRYGKKI
ncbi:MAG: DUF4133 domain-containing protein [Flavobacteriaceae bacterium]|nr:DUF4133 domain-containing protein [Flavobacteriaceae bacterium]MCY4253504.1 DUF4133 domain-containing protein [Flavobacteriaceae bacterium]